MNKKEFDKWNDVKKKTHHKHVSVLYREQEIWWCSLGVNIGVVRRLGKISDSQFAQLEAAMERFIKNNRNKTDSLRSPRVPNGNK
jgi:hypothetical protein